MNTKNPVIKSFMNNIRTSSGTYILSMLLSFVVRSVMVQYLGREIVGLNGVLTSVITSLSIADLGVDSVFVFLLYKPLANENYVEINNIMRLFKRIYIVIGGVFLVIGTFLLPFLSSILGNQSFKIDNVSLIFYLFVLNAGLSYFFAYYRIILNADQKYFVIAKITFIVTVIVNSIQIIAIIFFHSFLIYATIQLIGTLVINLIIKCFVKNNYSKIGPLNISKPIKLSDSNIIKILIKNTLGGISNKLGSVIVFSSDNILLAHFVSLQVVGMYSNYILITQGITSFITKIFLSITSSIGNMGIKGDAIINEKLFLKSSFIVNTVMIIILVPMGLCFSIFIQIWVGYDNVLPITPVILILVNFILQCIRFPALTFIDAFGLQWIQKWKSVVEALVNICISLILLVFFNMDLTGVLLGTLCSNVFVVNWYEPYIVIKEVCGGCYNKFIKQTLLFGIIFSGEIALTYFILQSNILDSNIFVTIVLSLFIVFAVLLILMIVFKKDENFIFFKDLILKYSHIK